MGHDYTYRVKANNFLGYGPYSVVQTFKPRTVPSKPGLAPWNSGSTRSMIQVTYAEVLDNGGSAITVYNVYLDDGMDGPFSGPYPNGLSLTWDSTLLPSLTTGLTYRLKYSAVNSEGESPLSDEVAILLAEVPSAPLSLQRIDSFSLPAGKIRVTWALPLDDGGSPVTGYKLYLDNVLYYDGSQQSTLVTFTLTNLIVSRTYQISVTAINAIGESISSSLTTVAASVPSKMTQPYLVSADATSITIGYTLPSFDGGLAITGYAIQRDNGPLTSFQPAIVTPTLSYTFTGLSTT